MNATQSRFVRRTTLREDEYRTNFRQVDRDAIELLKSAEARQVTSLMAALYLTLIDARPNTGSEREYCASRARTAQAGRLRLGGSSSDC